MMWLRRLVADLAIYRNPVTVRMFFLGFSAGLPLLLVFGTLSFWLRESGVDLKTIGFMSWAGLCWGLKWMWAPLVDRLNIPFLSVWLGRRRSWLLLAQIGLMITLTMMAFTDPAQSIAQMAVLAVLTAFFGATQDIALDAFRIESGTPEQQSAYVATYQAGYRIAMIWAGAGALAIAAMAEKTLLGSWCVAYLVMAASMFVGVAAVFMSQEPAGVLSSASPTGKGFLAWLYEAACCPFIDFFSRFGWGAVVILMLISIYRISDIVMGVMANPFYFDMGFTKEEVAAVSKVFGLIMSILGAFVGGVVSMKIGVIRTLLIGAVLSAATNLLFSALALVGHSVEFLIFTISADNLSGGLASAAFVAYLSGLTNKRYSATQYALLSSIMLLIPKFIAGFSGVLVTAIGYNMFFIATACMGIPVVLLVLLIAKIDYSFR